jgi:circadian clock protein KaiC
VNTPARSIQMMTPMAKVATGVPGLDTITKGGFPAGRAVVVAGTAGSAKTVLAAQFLRGGIDRGEPGVFVTCGETPANIRANVRGFGWDVAAWEAAGSWVFIDATRTTHETVVQGGAYDLTALLTRIQAAVRKVGAKRVVVDSLDSLYEQFGQGADFRNELHRVFTRLGDLGVTTVLTIERSSDYGPYSARGVEEFVSDNLILLRNVLTAEKRRRTVEILKFRGTGHGTGEFGFSVNDAGITVIPHLDIADERALTDERVTSGSEALDAMCNGGLFRDSVALVSGAAGTGKTLLMTTFTAAGVRLGERCLLFAFEERREQLFRNARGWGFDFEAMERDGLLKIVAVYPEVATLEEHLVTLTRLIDEYQPTRVAVDSLSALERVGTVDGFRKFVVSLCAFIKHRGLTAMLTSTTPTFLGGASHTESHLSTVTDLIILLRHSEMAGALRRGLVVLKMRGSSHDKDVREFTVDASGMHVGAPYSEPAGVITASAPATIDGNPGQLPDAS